MKQEQMEKRFQELKKNNPYSLQTYWDYNDFLSEKTLMDLFNEEISIYEVVDDCYEMEEINSLLNQELTQEELENEELKEYLVDKCRENWNYNFDEILNKSYVRLRITLFTNEDFLDVEFRKETDTYKYLKKRFKGIFKVKDFENEFSEVCGTNLVHLTFITEVNGKTLLEIKNQIEEKGTIKLTKGIKAGFFNECLGAGSCFDLELSKNINLNVKDWTKSNEQEYEVQIEGDEFTGYGVNETYGFTNDMWVEMEY